MTTKCVIDEINQAMQDSMIGVFKQDIKNGINHENVKKFIESDADIVFDGPHGSSEPTKPVKSLFKGLSIRSSTSINIDKAVKDLARVVVKKLEVARAAYIMEISARKWGKHYDSFYQPLRGDEFKSLLEDDDTHKSKPSKPRPHYQKFNTHAYKSKFGKIS